MISFKDSIELSYSMKSNRNNAGYSLCYLSDSGLSSQLIFDITSILSQQSSIKTIIHNSTQSKYFSGNGDRVSHFTLSSSRENPFPSLTFMLYFKVCPWTMGLRGPAVGLGKILTAFFWRAEECITHESKLIFFTNKMYQLKLLNKFGKHYLSVFLSFVLVDWTKSWHSFANASGSVH